jgi:hypothetical protein
MLAGLRIVLGNNLLLITILRPFHMAHLLKVFCFKEMFSRQVHFFSNDDNATLKSVKRLGWYGYDF